MALNGTLGFLGFGNMGSAIAQGLVATGTIAPGRILACDLSEERRQAAAEAGLVVVDSPSELAAGCNTLVLAVKPQGMGDALDLIEADAKAGTLVVTIAAGISIAYIQARLGAETRVVRVMPNTPALVNAGAAGIAVSGNCSEADAETARTIFGAIGIAAMVPEELIDTVTALSGSGPAYFFYMVECLADAAVANGLGQTEAVQLAGQTLLGAGRLLMESGEAPSVLRERVTSKGGTTAAALEAFRANGFDRVIAAGVNAAVARAAELGQ
ncbi:MAG: pyrroline-5-carboxylate reductase [Nitrospiraceae bacterium]|nr:pyrroline-5-carboxylate reductase [Nitrospiraceae bacterium]